MLVAPDTKWFQDLTAVPVVPVQQAPREESLPFMLVESAPRKVPPPERPRAASDFDRRAASPERAVNPTNDQPVSRGNSADMLEGTPAPPPPERPPVEAGPRASAAAGPPPPTSTASAPSTRPVTTPSASPGLGESLRNMDQLIKRERFDNPTGGPNANDPAISFDSKGV